MSPKTINSRCVAPVGLSSSLSVHWLDTPASGSQCLQWGRLAPNTLWPPTLVRDGSCRHSSFGFHPASLRRWASGRPGPEFLPFVSV